jgi:hypothetical protein
VGNGTNATPVVRNNRCILRAGFTPPAPVILEPNAGPDTIDISWTVGECLGTEVHTFHVLFREGFKSKTDLDQPDVTELTWQRSPPIAASSNGDQVSTYRIVRLKPGYHYQIVVLAESFEGFSSPPQELEGKSWGRVQKGPGILVCTLKPHFDIDTMVALMGVVRRRNPIELAAIGCLCDPTTGEKLDSVLRERAENAPAGGSHKKLLAGSENARASSTGDSKVQREQPSRSTEGTVLKVTVPRMEPQSKNTWNNAKVRLQKYMEQQRKNKEFLSFIKSQLCECKELRDEYVRSAALHACARSHRCHRDRRNCPMVLSCATTMFRL